LAAYKSRNIKDIADAARIVGHVYEEMKLHLSYCESLGISEKEMINTEEDMACTAYTRYVLDIGQSSDLLALQVAMAPCLFGYAEIARFLYDDPNTKRQENIYFKWIEDYVDTSYTDAVETGRALLEGQASKAGQTKIEELVEIFATATKLEKEFWNMGFKASR
jgi:thiaminase